MTHPPVIPLPAAYARRPDPPLVLGPGPVLVAAASPAASAAAAALADVLRSEAGVDASVGETASPAAAFVVRVGADAAPALAAAHPPPRAAEGYELAVDAARGELRALTEAGAFYGVQTVRQLLALGGGEAATAADGLRRRAPASSPPPAGGDARGAAHLPAWDIVDAPAWGWRGLLVDTARRFAPLPWLLRTLDAAASLKLNVLHLHLADDQGWRLPVGGRPALTGVGAWRAETAGDGVPHGGAYSAADLATLAAAAAARHMQIVPGLEGLPGHAGAALAAYPECACGGGGGDGDGDDHDGDDTDARASPRRPRPRPRTVPTTFGVQPDTVLCAGSPAALALADAIVDGALAAFPAARYIHVGGDEVPKAAWAACPACAARADELLPGGPDDGAGAVPGVAAPGHPGGPRPGAGAGDALHSWFVARAAARVAAAGRTPLCWDDVEPGGYPVAAAVTAWRGGGAGARAAGAGRPTVMAPAARCYLDYRQSAAAGEPGAWWGVLTLRTALGFDPGARDDGAGGGSSVGCDGGGEEGRGGGPSPAPPPPPRTVSLVMQETPTDSAAASMSCADGGGAGAGGTGGDDDAASGVPPPPPRLSPAARDAVLGGQACLWTETVEDEGGAEYLMFPRLHALAEALWSPLPPAGAPRDYDAFLDRLDVAVRALDARGVRRRPHR